MGVQFGSPKIVKNLDFGKQAKDKLIKGIDKLSEAVATTLGASGRTVVLEDDFGNPHVTKDGVTVACLLYTSPSPRDATLSRMPSSA